MHLEKDKEVKMKLADQKEPFKKFRLVDNLDEKVMLEFISWCRYVEYEGDMNQLYFYKKN